MKIKVERFRLTEISSIGKVYINDKLMYYSLEDRVRGEGVKIYGKTAIPYGVYKIIIDYSNRFKKLLPHILDVPMFAGIRIHAGNIAENTEGCILFGMTFDNNYVGRSREALNSFILLLEAAITRGEECTVEVSNADVIYDERLTV
jgi:hypothetical protein